MRIFMACWGMLFLLLTGCHSGFSILGPLRPNNNTPAAPQGTINAEQLVAYMNENAERIRTLRCDDVQVRAAMGLGLLRHANLDAMLVCEQSRNFRMRARPAATGSLEVDIGSNQQEFWFFIPKAHKAQIYCSYDDLEAGRVQHLPFPFQPEWVMETLGMGDFGPADKYQLKEIRDEIHLIERVTSPDGKAVRKVIVFNRHRANVAKGEPQIKAFLLVDDESGKEICSARIHSAQYDRRNAALLPKKMELRWPDEDITLTMTFVNPEANIEISAPDRNGFFARRPENGFPSVNLAQLQGNAQPSAIRRVGN